MIGSTSVVIPVYNGSRFLKRCLPTIVTQTIVPFEVVIVDDGSQDRPETVIEGLDLPVRLIKHGINRGLPAARNTGIKASVKEWVALLDCDDCWHPDKLARQTALIEADPSLDLVFCDFVHRDELGSLAQWRGGIAEQLRCWGVDLEPIGSLGYRLPFASHELLIEKKSFIHPSSVLIRKKFLERIGFFDERMRHLEDLEMWIRAASFGVFGMVDAVLLDVEQRMDSHGHQQFKMGLSTIELYNRILEDYKNLPKNTINACIMHLAAAHAATGWALRIQCDMPAARFHFRAAARLDPGFSRRLALWKTYVPDSLASPVRRATVYFTKTKTFNSK